MYPFSNDTDLDRHSTAVDEMGRDQMTPPVNPPASRPPNSPPPTPTPPARRRWWSGVGVAVLIVAMIAASFFVGRGTASPTATTVASAPTTTAATAGPTATLPAGTEPVAAVAAALMPSVVQISTQAGLGSGVIYDSSGLILTAAHVVQGASQVTVVLSDGTRVQGTVVGADTSSDVGVVKIDHAGLKAAPLATGTKLEVGQMAIAIGSPFGLSETVTAGVVSAVSRPVPGPDGRVRNLLQTDAPINPGNSGGPLADRAGSVIGINDSIESTSGGNIGVGFAIPIDTAKSVADKLVNGQPVQTPELGITGTDTTSGQAGALVTGVLPGSGAAKAGLQPGDLIVSFGGKQVTSFTQLAGLVREAQPGQQVTIGVVRNGKQLSLQATLGVAS